MLYFRFGKYEMFALLLLGSLRAMAQEEDPAFLYKWEPNLTFEKRIADIWSLSTTLHSLYNFGTIPAEADEPSYLERSQIQFFGMYLMEDRMKIGLGYMFRFREPLDEIPAYENRITQQFNAVTDIAGVSLRHRLRQEQRIFNDGYENRTRYRLGYDFPLSGPKVDVGETFISVSEELVFTYNSSMRALENRTTAGLGWKVSENQSFKGSLHHRFPGVHQDQKLHFITTYTFSF